MKLHDDGHSLRVQTRMVLNFARRFGMRGTSPVSRAGSAGLCLVALVAWPVRPSVRNVEWGPKWLRLMVAPLEDMLEEAEEVMQLRAWDAWERVQLSKLTCRQQLRLKSVEREKVRRPEYHLFRSVVLCRAGWTTIFNRVWSLQGFREPLRKLLAEASIDSLLDSILAGSQSPTTLSVGSSGLLLLEIPDRK